MEKSLSLAREFAVKWHGDKKYGPHPYVHHLDAVVGLLKEYGVSDPEVLAAGYLHDVVEDSDVSVDDLKMLFGLRVANIVDLVSKPEGGMAPDVYFARVASDPDAVAVKLADRIANVEALAGKHLLRLEAKYRAEYPVLVEKLYKPGLHEALFERLAEASA